MASPDVWSGCFLRPHASPSSRSDRRPLWCASMAAWRALGAVLLLVVLLATGSCPAQAGSTQRSWRAAREAAGAAPRLQQRPTSISTWQHDPYRATQPQQQSSSNGSGGTTHAVLLVLCLTHLVCAACGYYLGLLRARQRDAAAPSQAVAPLALPPASASAGAAAAQSALAISSTQKPALHGQRHGGKERHHCGSSGPALEPQGGADAASTTAPLRRAEQQAEAATSSASSTLLHHQAAPTVASQPAEREPEGGDAAQGSWDALVGPARALAPVDDDRASAASDEVVATLQAGPASGPQCSPTSGAPDAAALDADAASCTESSGRCTLAGATQAPPSPPPSQPAPAAHHPGDERPPPPPTSTERHCAPSPLPSPPGSHPPLLVRRAAQSQLAGAPPEQPGVRLQLEVSHATLELFAPAAVRVSR